MCIRDSWYTMVYHGAPESLVHYGAPWCTRELGTLWCTMVRQRVWYTMVYHGAPESLVHYGVPWCTRELGTLWCTMVHQRALYTMVYQRATSVVAAVPFWLESLSVNHQNILFSIANVAYLWNFAIRSLECFKSFCMTPAITNHEIDEGCIKLEANKPTMVMSVRMWRWNMIKWSI